MGDRGKRVGKYELFGRIASGGMAEVFLGRIVGEAGFEKPVAIKFVRPDKAGDPVFRDLFVREARVAASMSHPNLVHVFDFGRENDGFFLVMEYVDGLNLAQVVARTRQVGGVLPLGVWRLWSEGILSGLAALHARGVVHGDISTGNVLVTRDGSVKVTDFGVARRIDDETAVVVSAGKSAYSAPERKRGEGDPREWDLYGAAVTIGRLLGAMPDGSGSDTEETDPLRHAADDVHGIGSAPTEIREILSKALAGNPVDRFGSADAFLSAMRDLSVRVASPGEVSGFWDSLLLDSANEETVVHLRSASASVPEAPRFKGKRIALAAVAAILVGVAAAGIVSLSSLVSPTVEVPTVSQAVASPKASPEVEAPVSVIASQDQEDAALQSSTSSGTRASKSTLVALRPSVKQEVATPNADAGVSDKPVSPSPPHAPASRIVLLETDPAGITVRSDDGRVFGTTPISVDGAEVEGVRLTLSKDGYSEKTIKGDALARAGRLKVMLERQMGTVEAIQATPWAKVYDGETLLGTTPIMNASLPAGERKLRFVNEPLGADRTIVVVIAQGINPKIVVPLTGSR